MSQHNRSADVFFTLWRKACPADSQELSGVEEKCRSAIFFGCVFEGKRDSQSKGKNP